MRLRGLKTRIIFNMAVLLLVAMALIDLVVIATAQKRLIQTEAAKGRLAASLAAHSLTHQSKGGNGPSAETIHTILRDTVKSAGSICTFFVDNRRGAVWHEGTGCSSRGAFKRLAEESAANGSTGTDLEGTTWAVFWRGPRHLVVSAPIKSSSRLIGGISVAFELERIYAPMRKSQKIFLIYILVNTIVLTFVGFYRISRLYLMPVNRMAQRAEGYREDTDMPFAVRKEDNELKVLSNALNQMIRRIAEDKRKLRESVRSLEAANRELKRAQGEVIRAEKLSTVGRLSSGIAHEIGNPIGIVLGYLELLKRSDVSDLEKKDYIARSEEEIGRISSIIRQLLDYSKPAAGAPEAVSANLAIAEVSDMLRILPVMSDIDFAVHATAQPDTVIVDPNHLKQILINAVLNAADAIGACEPLGGGRISMASKVYIQEGGADGDGDISCPKAMLTVQCSDNGCGIPEDQIAYIFDPFYTTKGPRKGTGLGLSVSYMIAEAMGGRLEIASTQGEGSTLYLHLPLCREHSLEAKVILDQ